MPHSAQPGPNPIPHAESHPLDVLMDTQKAAAYLAISPLTLIDWRCKRTNGPAWVKCGSLVRYRLSDLQTYLESRTEKGA